MQYDNWFIVFFSRSGHGGIMTFDLITKRNLRIQAISMIASKWLISLRQKTRNICGIESRYKGTDPF